MVNLVMDCHRYIPGTNGNGGSLRSNWGQLQDNAILGQTVEGKYVITYQLLPTETLQTELL
jgi:hypothetical protein